MVAFNVIVTFWAVAHRNSPLSTLKTVLRGTIFFLANQEYFSVLPRLTCFFLKNTFWGMGIGDRDQFSKY
jgi:hypothetical protein